MIRIAITEDNPFIANTVKQKLGFFNDFKLKFHANNGVELLGKLSQDSNIELILMDIQMPEMNGIEALKEVRQKYPQIKVVMLTVFDDDEHIFKSIQSGAHGYLLKDINPDELRKGILDVLDGGASLTPSIALKAIELLRNPISIDEEPKEEYNLSKRETQVLEQVATGLNHHAIAENLNISSGTVRKHIENVYRKLEVHNKIEAISKAKSHRLI